MLGMTQFVMWQNRPDSVFPSPALVAERMKKLFAPLFVEALDVQIRSNSATHTVYIPLPVRNFTPLFVQEDQNRWALASQYPLNAHSVLRRRRQLMDPARCLPAFAQLLEEDPTGAVAEIHPPFLMTWSNAERTWLQNDGLGHAQGFEAEHLGQYAWSNRIFAFEALGIPLRPVPEEWAMKTSFGWFPMDTSGFENIKFLRPGTRLTIDEHEIQRECLPILQSWIEPQSWSEEDCKEIALQGMMDYVRDTAEISTELHGGLTGGFDSRAIFATYRHLGIPIRARVKGPAGHIDVRVARELAQIAGIPLKHKEKVELPPTSLKTLETNIASALHWQAGQVVNHKHKTFLPEQGGLEFGDVNVMGHDGAIVRSFFEQVLKASAIDASKYEDKLSAWFLHQLPPYLRDDLRDRMAERVREICHSPLAYGLEGTKQLDFLYLYERSRRWSSGTQCSQTGVVLAPFLSVEMIRLAFSYRGEDMKKNVFHRHITSTFAPEWKDLPYEKDLRWAEEKRQRESGEAAKALQRALDPNRDWREAHGWHYYDRIGYWRQVGSPLIQEIIRQGEFWREIFDAGRVGDFWAQAADELAILGILERLTTPSTSQAN